jgi:hypothetical protein
MGQAPLYEEQEALSSPCQARYSQPCLHPDLPPSLQTWEKIKSKAALTDVIKQPMLNCFLLLCDRVLKQTNKKNRNGSLRRFWDPVWVCYEWCCAKVSTSLAFSGLHISHSKMKEGDKAIPSFLLALSA